METRRIFTIGCALFTMLFGAGNIIFPLILGRSLGSSWFYAMVGFSLTAVVVPLVGFIAVNLAKGDYVQFLGGLGKGPATILALLCMALMGPFAGIPRCIAISYADLAWYFPEMGMPTFSILAASVIWIFTYNRSNIISILGKFLGPVKVSFLLAIVFLGLFWPGSVEVSSITRKQSFVQGLFGGYSTMDLIGVLFLSQLIYLEMVRGKGENETKDVLKMSFKVSLVAGILMTAVYLGFGAIAAIHGYRVVGVADDTLLSALASNILGSKAGVFANMTIVLTCLTTGIALTTTFADFLSRSVFKEKVSYRVALTITVFSSALVANLKLAGIMNAVLPLVSLFYPALAVYALLHVANTMMQRKLVNGRLAFFFIVGLTAVANIWKS